MNTVLPVVVIATTLACTTQIASAGDGCLKNDQRNTALGQAIGVLVYDSIVREYSQFASVDDIAAGLRHASNRSRYKLAHSTAVQSDPAAGESSGGSLSVSEAQNIIKTWRFQSDQLSQRFLTEYKQRGDLQQSGLLTFTLSLDHEKITIEGRDKFAKCTKNFSSSPDGELKQVCYMQLKIDEESVCNANLKAINSINSTEVPWTFGEFDPENVIEGWGEVFQLLDAKMKSEDQPLADADNGKSFHEVVIPPELAYGKKGMPGKVAPNETLWFVMAIN